MKKLYTITLFLTILMMSFVVVSATDFFVKEAKTQFETNLKELDTKTICDKEKEIKPFIDKKILGITIKTYQELKCDKDYLLKPEKKINNNLIKQDEKIGVIKISNE